MARSLYDGSQLLQPAPPGKGGCPTWVPKITSAERQPLRQRSSHLCLHSYSVDVFCQPRGVLNLLLLPPQSWLTWFTAFHGLCQCWLSCLPFLNSVFKMSLVTLLCGLLWHWSQVSKCYIRTEAWKGLSTKCEEQSRQSKTSAL